MFEELKKEMSAFYDTMRVKSETVSETGSGYLKAMELGREISEDMDLYFSANPGISSALLKSRLHTLIAGKFRPVIFPDSPFYFEMGLRHACSWGMDDHSPASWQHHTFYKRSRSVLSDYLDKRMKRAYIQSKNSLGLCSIPAFFDIDHHTLGYTKLFECGLEGIRSEIKDSLKQYKEGSDEAWYLQAMEESLTALETISGRFADEALRMLPSAETDSQRHCLTLIARTAGRVPANPPRTFYEGLAMILFLREVTGTIEDIGISSLSHADRLLGDLYETDIREGRLTREEAKELIGSWMLFTDIKFDLARNSWPETSTCVTLGGSDKNGRPIFNEVTRLFIEVHSELKNYCFCFFCSFCFLQVSARF